MATDAVVKKRQRIERRIVKHCIEELLANELNFHLGLNDGEEIVVNHSRNAKDIMKAACSTDEDYLLVYLDARSDTEKKRMGWVRFVYGNDGYDVICDYTTWLEPHIKATEELAREIERKAS